MGFPLRGRIVGIMHIINDSLSDVVKSDETRILYGKDWFYETLLGLKFRISTFSFFQPNSLAAEVLYSVVRDYIEDTEGLEVFDLYSGTGTIAQLLAPVAKEVIGVEIVEDAVAAARENAVLNGLENCRFLAGDVLKILDEVEGKAGCDRSGSTAGGHSSQSPAEDPLLRSGPYCVCLLQGDQPCPGSGELPRGGIPPGEGVLRGPVLRDRLGGDCVPLEQPKMRGQ